MLSKKMTIALVISTILTILSFVALIPMEIARGKFAKNNPYSNSVDILMPTRAEMDTLTTGIFLMIISFLIFISKEIVLYKEEQSE